jgi:TRAP-type C4-dicarboxylate transport system substrate-binding protein
MIPAASGQSSTSQQTGKRVRITLGHHHPPGDQIDVYAHDLADLVAKKTNGQATVEIIPAAQLGAEQEAVKGIQFGTLQMTVASDPFLSDYVNEIETRAIESSSRSFGDQAHRGERRPAN